LNKKSPTESKKNSCCAGLFSFYKRQLFAAEHSTCTALTTNIFGVCGTGCTNTTTAS
jgi:hypothetical protein